MMKKIKNTYLHSNRYFYPFFLIKGVFPLLVGLIFLLALFTACDEDVVFEKSQSIQNKAWSYDDKVPFTIPIEDSLQLYNIYVNIRHTNNYAYSNLYVLIHTIYPAGDTLQSRVSLPLADKKGKWYGSGRGEIRSAQVLIQPNARLPQKGDYQFILEQNMRVNPLPEILDMGIRVEKVGE